MIITSRFILGEPNYELIANVVFHSPDLDVCKDGIKVGKIFDIRITGKEIVFTMDIEDDVIDLNKPPPVATLGITFRDGEHEFESVGLIAEKSWMHRCSYCGLKRLEREAELNGMKVTVQLSIDDVGWDVYVHPPDVEIPEHVRRPCGEDDLPEIVYWKSWLFRNYLERGCFCDD